MKKQTPPNYPPSVQSTLFGYLNPEQQKAVRPVMRCMKKAYQVTLCAMLLDYMESGNVFFSDNPLVDGMFIYLTRYNMPEEDNPHHKHVIRPLI